MAIRLVYSKCKDHGDCLHETKNGQCIQCALEELEKLRTSKGEAPAPAVTPTKKWSKDKMEAYGLFLYNVNIDKRKNKDDLLADLKILDNGGSLEEEAPETDPETD
jgi:hypothetical protein